MSNTNTLTELNDLLFEQLKRVSKEEMTQEELNKESSRTKMICDIAKNIVDNGKLTLDGAKFKYTSLDGNRPMPNQFKLEEKK